MVLMIWVNDFWTLTSIPKWLKHALAEEDYLGFSDLIFPWFLFVMGMSIPVSINHRINRGDTKILIFRHIVFRTIALVIMGLFHMNFEMYSTEFSILNTVTVSAQTDEALAMIQLRNRVQGGDGGSEPDGSFPLQLFPVTLSIETIGCPFFRHGQQFFFDYGTNTDIDNIYIVTGVDHVLKPGSYTSKLRLARVDKYGFFQTLEQRLGEIETLVSAWAEVGPPTPS